MTIRQTDMDQLMRQADDLVRAVRSGARHRLVELQQTVAAIEKLHTAPHEPRDEVESEPTKLALLGSTVAALRRTP